MAPCEMGYSDDFRDKKVRRKNKTQFKLGKILDTIADYLWMIVVFPIAFVVRVFRWTYHYDD